MSDSISSINSPLVSVRGLSRSFETAQEERLHVLNDINLDIAEGELVAIVGESGTGKSTLLHLLGALDRPDTGTVKYRGRNIFDRSDEELSRFRNQNVGFVFQFHHLLPEFSALENVMMPALIAKTSAAEAKERANELLSNFGLQDRLEHRPGELSGGERQRVAIARAMMNQPDVLLADEPTGNLDKKTADSLHTVIVSLAHDSKQTVIVVTHNPEFAALADRIVRLESGVLVEESLAQE
ncbi:MAG: ABC transporter ATP-binding protein [Bacteroidetes bacterium]|nr:MAG: ABC transporter ATP-binding protein [Bacteroidota bacterium]